MSSVLPTIEPVPAPLPYALWRIDLRGAWTATDPSPLSPSERARAQRFAFDKHRHRYIAAHLGLRQLLSQRVGVPMAALQFELRPHGKPRLAPPHAAVAFNLSDSEDVAVVAIADEAHGGDIGDIGVDVEVLRGVPDATELAAIHFTPTEQRELAAAPDTPARDRRFLLGWTRKEACLKAIGSGLSIGAHTFEAGLDEAPRRVQIPVGAHRACVEVTSIAVGTDCVAALARCIEGAPA